MCSTTCGRLAGEQHQDAMGQAVDVDGSREPEAAIEKEVGMHEV
jgi:hypothetical protein